MDSAQTSLIRYQAELASEFDNLFAHDTRVGGFKISRAGGIPQTATLKVDGRSYNFVLSYSLTPAVQEIPTPNPQPAAQPLLVVPRLSDHFLEACREKQVSVADLNGRLYLRGPGLLISLSALPRRSFRFDQEPRNVFVGKSVRIVRALLADPERIWRQADLITRTGATSGLVSRIVTYLTRQGILKKTDARRFRIANQSQLLDAWAEADDFARRTSTYRFTVLNNDPVQLAKQIRDVLTHGGPDFAFTQWIAARLRHPYTDSSLVSLYVSSVPSQDLLDKLGLRPVSDAGRVWFHVPTDEGIFREKQMVQELPLVTDAQIYVDLLKTGQRGPDQAQALREWSGFCRP